MQGGVLQVIEQFEIKFAFSIYVWNKIKISVIDMQLFVILNDKHFIIDNLTNEAFTNIDGGTVGFGSNNVISEFAEIVLSVVVKNNFMILGAQLKQSSKAKQIDT